jgi:hypothetical protein
MRHTGVGMEAVTAGATGVCPQSHHATADVPFVSLLDKIANELIASLTAISAYSAVSEQGDGVRSLVAGQLARSAQAVHLLQDVVSTARALPPTHEDIKEQHWRLMEECLRTFEQSAGIMQRSSDAISASRSYRIYLLDTRGHIDAAASFSVSKDDDAAHVADSVYEASDDVFSGYELWTGGQVISSAQGTRAARANGPDLHDAIRAHQDIVVDLEERLQKGFACVKRSRKLLEAASTLRDRTNAS